LLIDALRDLGLTERDFVVRMSSRTAWQEFYEQGKGAADKAYEFYQVVDKLEREDPEKSDQRLRELGFRLGQVKEFIEAGEPTADLRAILGDLDARGLGAFVKVDYLVIRGLAYYTGPVFEAFDRKGQFRAIAGGGRYDNLLNLISGGRVDLPALGFGMGDVVLTELLEGRGLLASGGEGLDVFVLVEDEALRPASLALVQRLRSAGLTTDFPLKAAKSDKQFKRALELRARQVARLVGDVASELRVRLKDLETREERELPPEEVPEAVIAAKTA
ncbi:MAG: ATP phosphoribosyltransferase regulatory subunit, partial [Candidatus Binatia bacterium]